MSFSSSDDRKLDIQDSPLKRMFASQDPFEEKTVKNKEELMDLEPMKTVIGRGRAAVDGVYRNFTVYYANALSPVINNRILHLSVKEYEKMLEEFLSSEEGRKYRKPDDTKIRIDYQTVITEERLMDLQSQIDDAGQRLEKLEASIGDMERSCSEIPEIKKDIGTLVTEFDVLRKNIRLGNFITTALLIIVLSVIAVYVAIVKGII